MNLPLPIALTCGDPSGIGPEIIARHLATHPQDAQHIVPVGPQHWLDTLPCPGIAVGPADFAAEAGKDFAFENAMRAAAAQASVVYRFLTEEEFRNAVKADFSSICR